MTFPVRYDDMPTVKATGGRPPANGPRTGMVALAGVILESSTEFRSGGIYNPRPTNTKKGPGKAWSCLAGETEVITPEGPIPIRDLAGRTVPVLTRVTEPSGFDSGGRSVWRDAPIKNYGKRELMRVVLAMRGAEREVFATGNHRWYTAHRSSRYQDGRSRFAYRYDVATTDELEVGALVPKQRPNLHSRLQPSSIGIAHGIVTGDGHLTGSSDHRFNGPAAVTLWGDKVELLSYFHPTTITGTDHRESGVTGAVLTGLPRTWKAPPSLTESTSYLAGWWAGLIATDGTVSKNDGAVTWSTTSEENLAAMLAVCERIGVGYSDARLVKGSGFERDGYWYQLAFNGDTVPESLVLRSHHLENLRGRRGGGRSVEFWKVVSVESTGRVEDVFCAEVEGSQCFTLGGHILTGNTHANGSAFDAMVAVDRVGWPDGNPIGWDLANALVERHAQLGVQQVMWAHRFWRAGTGWKKLSSKSLDHLDHLHIELTTQAADELTRDEAAMILGRPVAAARAMLQTGDDSAWVAELRLWLGLPPGSTGFDGPLREEVLAFQRAHQLKVDGVVGPQTWAALKQPARAHAAIHAIYRRVLGRDADLTGLAFWAELVRGGLSLTDLVAKLEVSNEAIDLRARRATEAEAARAAAQAAAAPPPPPPASPGRDRADVVEAITALLKELI